MTLPNVWGQPAGMGVSLKGLQPLSLRARCGSSWVLPCQPPGPVSRPPPAMTIRLSPCPSPVSSFLLGRTSGGSGGTRGGSGTPWAMVVAGVTVTMGAGQVTAVGPTVTPRWVTVAGPLWVTTVGPVVVGPRAAGPLVPAGPVQMTAVVAPPHPKPCGSGCPGGGRTPWWWQDPPCLTSSAPAGRRGCAGRGLAAG